MAKSVASLVKLLDTLVKEANPPNGSAPLGPVIAIGNEVAREWKTLRAALTNGVRTPE